MQDHSLSRHSVLWTAVAVAALCGPPQAGAQTLGGRLETRLHFEGTVPHERLGASIAAVGDTNGDGVPDILVGAPHRTSTGADGTGRAFLYSGSDGTLLLEFAGDPNGDDFGIEVCGTGDLDLDGVPDLAIGAPGRDGNGQRYAGWAATYSGSDGRLLWEVKGASHNEILGWSLARIGDLNGDGVSEIAVGAPRARGIGLEAGGAVLVLSGRDGSLVLRLCGLQADAGYAASLCGPGDVNGDGFPDIAVGATIADLPGRPDVGSVFVYSGADGSLLFRKNGSKRLCFFGGSLAAIGDWDQDGHPDLLVGMPAGGEYLSGGVLGYSGFDGSELFKISGPGVYAAMGVTLDSLGDVDGDGIADFLIGSPGVDADGVDEAGEVNLFSGASGDLICKVTGWERFQHFGFHARAVGDLDQDGFPEFAVSSHSTSAGIPDSDQVFVFGLDPFFDLEADTFSAGTGAPLRAWIGFPDEEAGLPYALLVSRAGTGRTVIPGTVVPLAPDRVLQRMLGGWSPPMLQNAFGLLDGAGDATAWIVRHPALTRLVGQTVHLAAVSFEPAGPLARLSSAARRLEILP